MEATTSCWYGILPPSLCLEGEKSYDMSKGGMLLSCSNIRIDSSL